MTAAAPLDDGFRYDDVVVVRWPAGEDERARLAAAGRPRLLLVAPAHEPPDSWGGLEDWLREPADAVELYVRRERLRRRMDARAPVAIDDDGLVHRAGRWVALSPMELALVRLLVDRQGSLVGRAEMVAAIRPGSAVDSHRAVDTFIRRARQRLEPLGVAIHNVRGAGFLLQADDLAV